MSWRYRCPACKVLLNPDETVILAAEREAGGPRLLVGLHPEPGNYQVYFPPDLELVKGERWRFFCPLCRADLRLAEDEVLCAIELHDEAGADTRVVFSRVVGQQATFVISGGVLRAQYGLDLKEFLYYTSIFR